MKTKSLIINIALLLSYITNYSQPNSFIYFDSIYDCNNNKWATAFTTYETGYGYFTAGISYWVTGKVICILKTDKYGNKLEVKNYGRANCDLWPGAQGSLTKTTDGGYALGGGITSSLNNKVLLVKFDANGDSLWTRSYGDNISGSFYTGRQCKQTWDKGYIIVGEKDMGGTNEDVLLVKTDSLGNLQWIKNIGGPYIDIGWTVAVTPDSGFIIGGYKWIYNVNYSHNALVIKTDSLGNIKWQKELGGAFDDGKAYVNVAKDGNLFVMFAYGFSQTNPNLSSSSKLNIIKLDLSGNIIWDKKAGPVRYALDMCSFNELIDGKIITAGYYSNVTGVDPATLFLLNAYGDSIWQKEYKKVYGYGSSNSFYHLQQTAGKGFILCGDIFGAFEPPNGHNFWLVKLDSMGCLEPNCDGVIIVEPLQNKNDNILKVFPNPAMNYFTIEYKITETAGSALIEIIDHTGRKLKLYTLYDKQNQIVIETKDIFTGIYYVRLLVDGTTTNTHKISIIK